jgi:hypothetical protein
MPARSLGVALVALAATVVPLSAAGGHTREGAKAAPCAAAVHHDVLPVWMRAGFSGGKPRIPYVLGKRGAIGGVLFGFPLDAPPAEHKNNKILWVPRRPSTSVAALWIKLQQMYGSKPVGSPVRRIIPTGPGPSYVDAPSVGCWRLTLSWSGRRDTLDLVYVAPNG